MTNLTTEQKVRLWVQFLTQAGLPGPVDAAPTWASSDESVITIAVDPADADAAYAVSTNKAGTATVTVTGVAGGNTLTASTDITVTVALPGVAVLTVGTPEWK